jgi:hypothetical protein
MSYTLFLILLLSDGPHYELVGSYHTMNECFEIRERLVETLGRPIENYQTICVTSNPKTMAKYIL